MGLLRWSPSDFRSGTFMEFTAAMKGYLVSKGVEADAPMTRNEFLDLLDEDKRKERVGNGN
jgi:hypothetical protein